MSTLVIGAHPDDEVLGPGGTIAKLARDRAEAVYVLIVTDGSSTQYPGDQEKDRQKKSELEACCRTLGVTELVHGSFPDMQLDVVPHTDLNDFISEHVKKWQPETVFTHYPDVNRDHVRIFESTLVAARPVAGSPVRQLTLYPTPSATEWDVPMLSRPFVPNCFFDISEHIETKIQAMECYETEIRPFPHPRSAEALRATARASGAKIGCGYAEEFMIVRNIA